MADSMRNNAGKLQLGYYLSTAAYDVEASPEFTGEESDEDLIEAGLALFARGELEAVNLIAGLKAILGEYPVAYYFTYACMGGAEKYVRGNYMKGAPISQYIDCAARHLDAIKYGDANYTETFTTLGGETVTRTFNHWHNLVWNLIMIHEVMFYAPNRDDRLFHMGNFGARDVVQQAPAAEFIGPRGGSVCTDFGPCAECDAEDAEYKPYDFDADPTRIFESIQDSFTVPAAPIAEAAAKQAVSTSMLYQRAQALADASGRSTGSICTEEDATDPTYGCTCAEFYAAARAQTGRSTPDVRR